MERFDESTGNAHAPGYAYKVGKHFAENGVRKMKKMEIKMELGRFTLLGDYSSQKG